MEDQELKNIWKRASEYQEITMDTQQLIRQFKTGMEQREQIVRRRDLREISTALVCIAGLSYMAFDFLWSPVTIGILITIGAFVNFIYTLRSNRKSKFTQRLFVPIKKQLEQQRLFMRNQSKLLCTVLYWAVLPIFSGYMMIVWSIWDIENYDVSSLIKLLYPNDIRDKMIMTVMVLASVSYMVWINKKAARVNWEPLINKIDVIINEMENER